MSLHITHEDLEEIREEPAELIGPDGNVIGSIPSMLVLASIRLKIRRNGLQGYKVRFRGEDIDINKSGTLRHWIPGLFPFLDDTLSELITWRDQET